MNNAYLARGELEWELLEGWWTDAGTFESLMKANELVGQRVPAEESGKQVSRQKARG